MRSLPRRGLSFKRNLFAEKIDVAKAREIVALMKSASFCPFGKGAANAYESLLEKLIV